MPGDPGATVVTTLVWFLSFHARLRAHRAPGIPHALYFFGADVLKHSPGAIRAAECADVRGWGPHPSRRAQERAPQDEVCQFLMVRSAATPRVSNHEARMSWLFDNRIRASGERQSLELRCAIAHRSSSRFRVWSFGPSRNDGLTVITTRTTSPSLPGSAETRPARRTCSRTTRAR
jgi:hypothetical protein